MTLCFNPEHYPCKLQVEMSYFQNLIKANHKDKDPIMKKSGVYKIDCKQCEKVYIGQTKRNLETRTKEHFRNVRLNHLEKSDIALHAIFYLLG